MSQKKHSIPVRGMHCRSCEILLEEELIELPGIVKVVAHYKTGEIILWTAEGHDLDMKRVSQCIQKAGYFIGSEDPLPWISMQKDVWLRFFLGLLLAVSVFGIFSLFGSPASFLSLESMPQYGFWAMILLGLIAGVSTCMALVGGLLLGLASVHAKAYPEASASQKFRPHVIFMAGRIISYTFLGGLLGVLGSVLTLSLTVNAIITLLIGGIMIFMGCKLVGIFPRLEKYTITLPKGLAKFFGIRGEKHAYTHTHAAILGALTFFVPCGITQMVQLYAISTGSFSLGAISMGLFALGTAPALLGLGGISALVKGKVKEWFFLFVGLLLILFGVSQVQSSSIFLSPKLPSASPVVIQEGVQELNAVYSGSLSPNQFRVRPGQKVDLSIDVQKDGFGCGYAIMIPELFEDPLPLKKGNTIHMEFIPQEAGEYPITCSMNMITYGTLYVE